MPVALWRATLSHCPRWGVSATLAGLEGHWQELQELKKKNDGKA